MPLTLPHRLVAGRTAQTGERPQQALDELRLLSHGAPPIPDAATPDQAFLEALFLERLGRWNPDRWRPCMQPFGIRSVSPRPHEIAVRVPAEFLPDIIHTVMPCWAVDDDSPDYTEVHGIPGLRARYEHGRGFLYRPGFDGRIAFPATPGLWRKAIKVAADLYGPGDQVRIPWQLSPHDWHAGEVRFTEAWPRTFSPAGSSYLGSGFESRILRRLPGLCQLPRANWHDLWVNHYSDGPDIQFEWQNGPAHGAVLERLLDPLFGPGAELELQPGQSAEDCYSGTGGNVTVRAIGRPGGTIVLRRGLSPNDGRLSEIAGEIWAQRCAEREALETKHGYRIGRRPMAELAGTQ